MADLRTKLGTLALDNPIIVSSGYVTETESAIRKADSFGPGAIVLKTSLPNDEYSQVVKPYAPHRYPSTRNKFALAEDGIMGAEGLSTYSLEMWAEWLAKNKSSFRTPLIGSVAAISVEGHVRGARLMAEAGAVAVELLLACPAPYFRPFKYTMTSDPQVVEEICRAVKEAVSIPVGAKIAPLSPVARAARAAGMDWITTGGVLVAAPGIDLESLEPVVPSAIFLSGARVNKYTTFRLLLSLAGMSGEVHLSAHGGVQDWRDVAEFILYGASSVQAQSIFMTKGFSAIAEMKRGLEAFMDKQGLSSLADMRGAIIPKLLSFDDMIAAYPETKGKIVAQVDEGLCNGCGICEDVCAWDAIKVSDGLAEVNPELCEGCRLCVADCPTEALSLENTGILRKALAR
jgi:dihydroorotate dehydrogenase/NAD-dependent dihydropyrimidine dehydrogenase PreA subunit